MSTRIVEEAIANIAAASKALEKYSNDPHRSCSAYAANLLERVSWDLHKQAENLREINYYHV